MKTTPHSLLAGFLRGGAGLSQCQVAGEAPFPLPPHLSLLKMAARSCSMVLPIALHWELGPGKKSAIILHGPSWLY